MIIHTKELSPKREALKKRIIETAFEMFSKYGLDNTTISNIAKSVGIGDGTIYLYFHNKTDLFIETYNLAIDIMLAEIDAILKKIDNPLARFYGIFDAAITVFQKRPEIIAYIVSNNFRLPRISLQDPTFQSFRYFMAYIQDICRTAIDKGFIREVDSGALAYYTHCILDYIARIWVISDYEVDMIKFKNTMLDITMYGLIP
ncbi:MAG: TetR/AcrR family transcriptional regulator [Candidatus Cloacimonetes bacterium]|nr:TetR/AcrR family transcriptional regulator [Candidatus Cloacimonadota bacterium]